MTKHHPAPWVIDPLCGKTEVFTDHGDEDGFGCSWLTCSGPAPRETLEANAARIVACVNACEGMDDPEAEVYRLRTIEGVLASEDPIPRRLWEIRRSWPISTINFLGRPPTDE